MSVMTEQQRADYEQLLAANGYRCMCDNSEGRAQCSKPHTAMPFGRTRCPHGAFVLVTEPDGTLAVICRDCEADRAKTGRRIEREAKAARAKTHAEAQTSIFDLLATLDPAPPDLPEAPPGYTLAHWHDPMAICLRHADGGCYWEARFPAPPSGEQIEATIAEHWPHCRINPNGSAAAVRVV